MASVMESFTLDHEGEMLARLATQVTFEELLTAMPVFERRDAVLSWVPSSNFRSPRALQMVPG